MPEWMTVLLLVAGYIAIMRWVLPRLGVPTWMSDRCDAGSRHQNTKRCVSMKMRHTAWKF